MGSSMGKRRNKVIIATKTLAAFEEAGKKRQRPPQTEEVTNGNDHDRGQEGLTQEMKQEEDQEITRKSFKRGDSKRVSALERIGEDETEINHNNTDDLYQFVRR